MKNPILLLFLIFLISCVDNTPAPPFRHEKYEMPDQRYGSFFREIIMLGQVPDMQFADAVPKGEIRDIINAYRRAKNDSDFSVKEFLEQHFDLPAEPITTFSIDENRTINQHIEALWPYLKRPADRTPKEGSPVIAMPFPYIVNEGKMTDIRYWDSYFTMLGLLETGDIQAVRNMVDNFAYLIDEVGYVPYGNRTYLATMSNPPFFTSMVEMLAPYDGEEVLMKYAPQIEKEYTYWMKMSDQVSEENIDSLKIVKIDTFLLNRFRDENPWPRTDQYRNDLSLASNIESRPSWQVFQDLRAGAESGWNFTSRWFLTKWRSTIMTSEILPVDLNAILCHIEETLARIYELQRNNGSETDMLGRYQKRKNAINTIFWDDDNGIYLDYQYKDTTLRDRPSLAMMYPLYFGVASREQADRVANYIENEFLTQGGVVSSTHNTGQRWDHPNGWPHLQWITVMGLERYGHSRLAKDIAMKWTALVERIYREEYRFLEFYDVVEPANNDVDDDYPSDGYGPTIGVYLALKQYLTK